MQVGACGLGSARKVVLARASLIAVKAVVAWSSHSYDDSCFAHPHFSFFALNTEMQWRALQTGRVYVKQHPGDAQLWLNELHDVVGWEGEVFSNCVLHYDTSTKQYWFKQHSTYLYGQHSWSPNHLLHSQCSWSPMVWAGYLPRWSWLQTKAAIENPAVSDRFFYHRVLKLIDAFHVGVL